MRTKRILVGLVILFGSISGSLYLMQLRMVAQSSLNSQPTDSNVPAEVIRKGNKKIPPGKLIKQEQAVGKLSNKVKLKKAELSDWEAFKASHLPKGADLKIIDPDRQVWEVQTENSAVEVSQGAIFENAVVTRAVDAETGELLYVRVVSNNKDVKFKKN